VWEHIECNQVDLTYESYRLRNESMERRIFLSLERHGIHNPLMGMTSEKDTNRFVLLDGFKRIVVPGSLA
jgi:hypothetical protein